MGTRFGRFF
jgi:transposase InsO family protein